MNQPLTPDIYDPLVKREPMDQVPINHPQQHMANSAMESTPSELFKTSPYSGFHNHNPFDVNSYPMTNPPIIDSTMFLPYINENGVQRRRRISISNGQIGQMINHVMLNDQDTYDDKELLQRPQLVNKQESFQQSPMDLPHHRPPPQRVPHLSHHNMDPMGFDSMDPLMPQMYSVPNVQNNQNQSMHNQSMHNPNPNPQLQQLHQPPPVPVLAPVPAPPEARHESGKLSARDSPDNLQSVAGVPPPNYQLLYNNEVIFSSESGPIPGTAAWKKERLLERNRVAASKCRQRKKQAQQQLQENISRLKAQIADQQKALQKHEKIKAVYDDALAAHFESGRPLDSLRQYVKQPLDSINI